MILCNQPIYLLFLHACLGLHRATRDDKYVLPPVALLS